MSRSRKMHRSRNSPHNRNRQLYRIRNERKNPSAYQVDLSPNATRFLRLYTMGGKRQGKSWLASNIKGYNSKDVSGTGYAKATPGGHITNYTVQSMQAAAMSFQVMAANIQAITAVFATPNPLSLEDEQELVAGTITGWRVWTIYPERGPYLFPMNGGHSWVGGENTARHSATPQTGPLDEGHVVAQPNCTCGFWAVTRPGDLPSYYVPTYYYWGQEIVVLGQIEGWGNVTHHTYGFRAEHARVKNLRIEPETDLPIESFVRGVAVRYDVPVIHGHRDPSTS